MSGLNTNEIRERWDERASIRGDQSAFFANIDVRALCDALDTARTERNAWRLLAEGRQSLLVAYRTGSQPPESAFKKIDQARALLGDQ